MPRDQRLYMTFPNDMWMHPKVAPLTDAAFRAFVEMNGYSRMQDLDGSIPLVMARRMWSKKAIDELAASHPDRPLVLVDEQHVVIRDYAEHQQTVAEREARAEVSRANGRKGGRPRKNPNGTQAESGQVCEENPDGTQAKAESETETDTPLRGVARKRATRIPDPFLVTGEMRSWAAENTPAVDVNASTAKFVDYWRGKAGKDATKLDWLATWRNWMRNDQDRAQPRAAVPAGPRPSISDEWLHR